MKIYVISDLSNKERSENIISQFANQEGNWQYEIVEAVMNPSQPQNGTVLSYKKCIKLAKKANAHYCMIIEDDVNFLTPTSLLNFYEAWQLYPYMLRGAILLGGIYEGSLLHEFNIEHNIPFSTVIGKIAGLHAMIIPCTFYKYILNAPENLHLDYHLSEEIKHKIYCMDPMEIIQMPFKSSNGNNMQELNNNLHLKYKLANGKRIL